MKAALFTATVALTAFGLAGCIEDGTGALEAPLDGVTSTVDNHLVTASDCITAGGISTYPMEVMGDQIGPFKAKDMSDYIGNPMVGTYGMPTPGGKVGIWHMTTACESHVYQGEDRGKFSMGWIAYMIEPPEFDTSGIERQYVVADLSFTNLEMVEATKLGTGVEVSTMFDGTVEWPAPNVFHSIVDEANHGVFETTGPVTEFDTHESEPIRFWMLVAVGGDGHGHAEEGAIPGGEMTREDLVVQEDGVKYLPVSFDIYDEMTTEGVKLAGPAYLSHTRNENHGNAVGAAGNVQGLVETGDFVRTIKLGPQPALFLDTTWTH